MNIQILKYTEVMRTNWHLICFGFLLTFFSSFGQTFFLALFNKHIETDLNISTSSLAFLYSSATILSALLITRLGKKIDNLDLRLYTVLVLILLCIAACCMAICSSKAFLFVTYLLLRLSGQGLMCHISMVCMARYFDKCRGRALSIASLGYPAGQSILPFIVILSLTTISWRLTWWIIAFFILIVLVPISIWLLKNHNLHHSNYLATCENIDNISDSKNPLFTNFLRDWRFYAIALGALVPAFINTGIFFQCHALITSKNWSFSAFTTSLVVFAMGNIFGSIIVGGVIDKCSAFKALNWYLIPLLLGLFFLQQYSATYILFIFMLFAGISQGCSSVIINAIWTEIYSLKYLGAIRSWSSAFQVLATGLAPFLFGYLLDANFSVDHIILLCTIYVAVSIGVLASVPVFSRKLKSYA